MSEYIMKPGARLEIGPHGQLEESLGDMYMSAVRGSSTSSRDNLNRPPPPHQKGKAGFGSGPGLSGLAGIIVPRGKRALGACCTGCASGTGCGALGDVVTWPAVLLGQQVAPAGATASAAQAAAAAAGGAGVAPAPDNTTTYLLLGAAGLGAFLLIRHRRAAAAVSAPAAPTSNPCRRRRRRAR